MDNAPSVRGSIPVIMPLLATWGVQPGGNPSSDSCWWLKLPWFGDWGQQGNDCIGLLPTRLLAKNKSQLSPMVYYFFNLHILIIVEFTKKTKTIHLTILCRLKKEIIMNQHKMIQKEEKLKIMPQNIRIPPPLKRKELVTSERLKIIYTGCNYVTGLNTITNNNN